MILSQQFKNIYKNAMNELIGVNGLSNQCTLFFNNGSADYCDNCIFDSISKISANIYNGSGPQPFPEYTVCPECVGLGVKQNNTKTKTITLAVIFDSKYFINFDKRVINIPDGIIQTICHKNYTLDIRNSSSMMVNTIPNIMYERTEDVNPAGLGDLDYVFTNWKRS